MLIIKQSDSIELARIYLKLYVKSMHAFMSSKNLYRYIDYSVHESVLAGGIAVLDVAFLSESAEKYEADILQLDIEHDEESVGIASLLAIAHIQREFYLPSGVPAFHDAIRKLHATPWENIDNVSTVDVKNAKINRGIVVLKHTENQENSKFWVTFAMNENAVLAYPEAILVFHELTAFTYWNMATEMEAKLAAYASGVTVKEDSNGRKLHLQFEIAPTNNATSILKDEKRRELLRQSFEKALHEYSDNDNLHQVIVDQYHDSTHDDPWVFNPNVGSLINNTGFVVGRDGWREIMTKERCKKVFQSISVDVNKPV